MSKERVTWENFGKTKKSAFRINNDKQFFFTSFVIFITALLSISIVAYLAKWLGSLDKGLASWVY